MIHDGAKPRNKTRAALALLIAALPLGCLDGSAVHAQSLMRSPSINIGARIPTINPAIAARGAPNIAGRVVVNADRSPRVGASALRATSRIGVPALPFTRYSPNLYPACGYAYRDGDGACLDQSVISAEGGGRGGARGKKANGGPRRDTSQAAAAGLRSVAGEIVAEIDASLTPAQADEMARRHGLARVESQDFPLFGATIGLFRVTDRRPVETVSREFTTEGGVRSVQPNFRYVLQQQKTVPTEGDPAQYALAKLRLPEAHKLAHGANVTIAVIDSGIDARHPELAGAIADSFDALGSKEGPHVHGTGVAGAIVAHARLMGSAPAAKILAIRAFGAGQNGAESTTFVLLKALDYAAGHGAQIINMSFAGPKDALVERCIAAAAGRDIAMIAASGNAGPKSPPLYPAANANVIAVSATDAQDKLFAASNRGSYVAVAAPGVDIFLPAPDGKYQMTSGTSFSAAYVSGLAALLLERNPALKPDELRAILMKTARDLGTPGRDDQFGAGEADAYAAVLAVAGAPAAPVAATSVAPSGEKASDRRDSPATRALNVPAAALASDRPAAAEADHAAAQ
jgi:subtilisin family serine protease